MNFKGIDEGLSYGKNATETLDKVRVELRVHNLISLRTSGILSDEQIEKVDGILSRYVDKIKA